MYAMNIREELAPLLEYRKNGTININIKEYLESQCQVHVVHHITSHVEVALSCARVVIRDQCLH